MGQRKGAAGSVPEQHRNLRGVFQELPEPNRACLVGVYAFLIWNNLCDLVYQTSTRSYQSQKSRFSTPTRT